MKASSREWPKAIKVRNVTVKVYRNAHASNASGWSYVLAWRTEEGRKREKFADEATALAEARTKATLLTLGKVEGADMSSSDRDELKAARRIAKTNETPLLAAIHEWARARQLSDGSIIAACEAWAARKGTPHKRLEVSDVVARFLKAKTGAGIQVVKNHNHIFEEIKAAFGESYLDAITAPQLGVWLAKREHPSTRNTFRKHVVALWRWAQKQGYLSREIKTEAEQTDRATEAPQDIGIISARTFRDVLQHIRAKHREYIAPLVLAGFCGLRRSEVHRQKWSDIELGRKFLRVTKGKRGTPSRRLVPLCDAAVSWLMLVGDRTDDVCSNLAMDRIRDIGRVAKFVLPENCFRHSFISARVAQTGNVAETSLEAGNSPTIIFKHYRELMTKGEGEAWFESAPGATGEIIQLGKAVV
jgi:integrase